MTNVRMPTTASAATPARTATVEPTPDAADFFAFGSGASSLKRSAIVAAAGAAGSSATPSVEGIESAFTVGRLTDMGFLIVMMRRIISQFRAETQVGETSRSTSSSPFA